MCSVSCGSARPDFEGVPIGGGPKVFLGVSTCDRVCPVKTVKPCARVCFPAIAERVAKLLCD